MKGTEIFCDGDPVKSHAVVLECLVINPNITAFIVMNDKALPGIIKAVEDTGHAVGDDISLVSIVSAGSALTFFLPPITAFEMNTKVFMDAVVEQLIAKLEGRYTELSPRLVSCELVIRMSTGIAKPHMKSAQEAV
jgi:DNA-binding LacI/PurR family transcriptional regulator